MTVVICLAIGFVLGVAVVLLVTLLPPDGWRRGRKWRDGDGLAAPMPAPGTFRALAVLDELPTATVVLDHEDDVLFANGTAHRLGIVIGSRLALDELREMIRQTRRDGCVREAEFDLPPVELRRRPLAVRVRSVAAGGGDVAVIIDDLTESRRLDAVRRDFVANISHELKTPVGAISLLAEAIDDARDDPDQVAHFIDRMQHESARLSRLVKELIDLSRLQGAEPLPDARPVSLRSVIHEAVDRSRLAASSRGIVLAYDETEGTVLGDERLLVTALGNLVENAVAYSSDDTRVSIAVRHLDDIIEVSVSDEGIGIASRDLERIFERFYRVDHARSRSTGGTGLGLSIVKHIATNHGGTVGVWSAFGQGSTFTLRFPNPAKTGVGLPRPSPTEV